MGDEFSVGWRRRIHSIFIRSSFPPRGKKSRAFRPAFVRFPTNEATPNEKTSERKERERERADAGTIGEEEEEEEEGEEEEERI